MPGSVSRTYTRPAALATSTASKTDAEIPAESSMSDGPRRIRARSNRRDTLARRDTPGQRRSSNGGVGQYRQEAKFMQREVALKCTSRAGIRWGGERDERLPLARLAFAKAHVSGRPMRDSSAHRPNPHGGFAYWFCLLSCHEKSIVAERESAQLRYESRFRSVGIPSMKIFLTVPGCSHTFQVKSVGKNWGKNG